MNKMEVFFRKHSSTILTVMSTAGVVATTVLAVKATPKAIQLIHEEKRRRQKFEKVFMDNVGYETVVFPKLTKLEIVKIAWKPYIPTIITGASTIACIFGINVLSTKNQASLMSAYALLDSSYKEYREKVKELYGEDADNKVKREIVKDKVDEYEVDSDDGKESFFDYEGFRMFRSTVEEVKKAEHELNKLISMNGYACLNDFYDILGVGHTDVGYQLGWSTVTNDDIYYGLKFELEKTEMDDGMECWIMTMTCPPRSDYIY